VDDSNDLHQDLSLRDILAFIRRGVLYALLSAVVVGALVYFVTQRIPSTYRATATVLASQPTAALQQFGASLVTAPTLDASAYRAAATSPPVLAAALVSLGDKKPTPSDIDALLGTIDIRTDTSQQSSLIHIAASSRQPKTAQATANALASALLVWDRERATRSLQDVIAALKGEIGSLDTHLKQAQSAASPDKGTITGLENLLAQRTLQLSTAEALKNSAVGNLEMLALARQPVHPAAPRPVLYGGLAFVLALVLAYAVLLVLDAVDMRFRSTDDLEGATKLPVLARFPRLAGSNRQVPREAANYLKTSVLMGTTTMHPKIVLVTSPGRHEGTTNVAMSLAEALARNHHRTLLIDADLHDPEVGSRYNLSGSTTVSFEELLEDPEKPVEPAHVGLDEVELDVLPCFRKTVSANELLSEGFARVLLELRGEYDAIVITSPPVLPYADALTVAPHCSGIVLTVSMLGSDRRNTATAVTVLGRAGIPVIGVVATNVASRSAGRSVYRHQSQRGGEKGSQHVTAKVVVRQQSGDVVSSPRAAPDD